MIRSVHVENWRRHRSFTHEFEPGLNFILGPNGRGKTSILQAIHFALFGGSTAFAKEAVRYDATAAAVSVEFDIDGGIVRLGRSVDARGRSTEHVAQNNVGKTKGPKTIDELLASTLGADPIFLSQLTLLAEGDIYRYEDEKTSNLTRQLALVMPLQEVIHLLPELTAAKKPFAKAQKAKRIELQVSKDEAALLRTEEEEIKKKLTELSVQENEARDKLKPIEQQLYRRQGYLSQKERHEAWRTNWLSLVEDFELSDAPSEEADVLQLLERQRSELEAKMRQGAEDRGRAAGRIESARFFIAMLKQTDEDKCPLCRQSLTDAHRREALAEQEDAFEQLLAQEKGLVDELASLQGQLQRKEAQLRACQSLTAEKPPPPNPDDEGSADVDEQVRAAQEEEQEIRAHAGVLRERSAEIREKLALVDADRRVEQEIISAFRQEALLEVAESGIQEFLDDVRNSILRPLAEELTRQWKAYRPDAEWALALDDTGTLCIARDETTRAYASLSGGEKAIALILFRIALLRAFSTCDFLILDEPLEHFDPRTRRLLVSALHQLISKGFLKQIIISTYEETLVRRLIRSPNVQAVFVD